METISFDRLLLKTAFCCMASDGNIDKKEVALIKKMCDKSTVFKDLDFKKEINLFVNGLNASGKEFINDYFELLKEADLSNEEELTLIEYVINTIKADDLIEYSEIKFFKVIIHNLKISDEQILEVYSDIESWLEEDIVVDKSIDKLINQYFDSAVLSQFELISNTDIESLQN